MEKREMFRVELASRVKGVKISRRMLQDVAMLVFREEKVSPRGILSVGFLGEEEIRAVKREFFNQDIDTDVVAFPYGEDDRDKVWGEILICIPVAQRQAAERKTKVEEEILFLFIHGLLHLLGYQDATEKERNAMDTRSTQFFYLFSEWQLRKKLVQEAWRAKNFAYAPYSHFRVGVALLGGEKKIFTGCNVENASFGLTICAERVALFKAVSMGIQKFEKIAIVSDSSSMCLPCGACRQVLAEFAPSLEIISATASLDFQIFQLEDLLPHRFHFDRGDAQ